MDLITKTLNYDFNTAYPLLMQELEIEGFNISIEIDMKKKMAAKLNKSIWEYRIIGIGKPDIVAKVLDEDMNIWVFMPCNIVIYTSWKGTTITFQPIKSELSNNKSELIKKIGEEIEEKFLSILENL